ncbi:right-handed parallel beta-helix repeat-containing protein [Streptomyces sp. NBC_01408]|uniref:right-handed parallel beta-helix repeat-containing protein n=1 Tax=Streptomyces sp. NBC_01408 TaxID=2903855 RepID=UPI00225A0153|nr:right-handed parallel beta-helix repeat-containing protein [Streptomyces sp. NBC_01408]MCX4693581.1 right-handed parallel beta-helix repeat-containing protein [Streptomyces sp. NBC_01408]
MFRLGVFAGAAAALATVVALPADAHAHARAQQIVLCSQTALSNAITQANTVPGPALLFLAPGCTYTLTAPNNPGNGLPVVTSDITIVGSQNIIRRQSAAAFRIFKVSGPNARLSLSNLTVRDGRSGGEGGGGIYVDTGSALTLNSVEVTRNLSAVSGIGAGIANFGTLTLRNSTVSYNISTNNGGGIFTNGTANISNTTITGNTAHDDAGGIDARGSLTLANSRVTDNAARVGAGGILAFNLTGTVTDTLIRGNTLAGDGQDGGGIFNRTSTLTLERTTVFANRALGSGARGGGLANASDATLTVRNSSVTHNFANAAPGGIFNNGGTLSLVATLVQDNQPTDL